MFREVGGAREHRLRVYAELIYGHEANRPAPGTHNFNRTCMPYPFLGKMTAAEAASDFSIAIDGFIKTAHNSPGARAPFLPLGEHAAWHADAGRRCQCSS